jgi:ABC-type dipeptide/oligopeptide/nickel transport system permease component
VGLLLGLAFVTAAYVAVAGLVVDVALRRIDPRLP